jgi:AcrR family transcriptional regulator
MARPKEHKPAAILASALSVFRAEGVNVSTARIASAAGVSNGTLFNYFPTKQGLIDALYVSLKTEMAEAVGFFDDDDSIKDRMHHVWRKLFAWAGKNRDGHAVMNLLHQSGLASAEAQAVGTAAFERPTAILNTAMSSGVFVDLPFDYLAAIILHHLDQAITSELDDDQAEVAFDVLWNGITRSHDNSPKKVSI